MARMESTVRINRPIEEVFAYAADQSKLSQWQKGLAQSELTSEGPTGVGSTYRHKFDLFGRRFETAGVISEYEENCKYSFRATSGSFPISGTFTFEEVWGGTRVTLVAELKQSGLSRLGGRLLAPMMESQLDENFERLREILEAEPEELA